MGIPDLKKISFLYHEPDDARNDLRTLFVQCALLRDEEMFMVQVCLKLRVYVYVIKMYISAINKH